MILVMSPTTRPAALLMREGEKLGGGGGGGLPSFLRNSSGVHVCHVMLFTARHQGVPAVNTLTTMPTVTISSMVVIIII